MRRASSCLEADITDFYEDDEPIEDVVAAFERGPKVFTAPPRGQTVYLNSDGTEVEGTWTA